jgi:hypothetical protein
MLDDDDDKEIGQSRNGDEPDGIRMMFERSEAYSSPERKSMTQFYTEGEGAVDGRKNEDAA